MQGEKRHVLPGYSGGDTTWFDRQNTFEQQEIYRQVNFKDKNWPDLGDGRFSKRPLYTYPHILPEGNEKFAFYGSMAESILSYLDGEDIALHTEVLNLKSSQAACLNILFPFRQDRKLAKLAFNPFLKDLERITKIDFEYTGPNAVTEWLGEPASGKRGQNRTSIDAAVFWQDRSQRKWATLIEWKYTEKNYGVCSVFSNATAEGKARCRSLQVADNREPETLCLLTTGERHRVRKYWKHMATAGIGLDRFAVVTGCPFQGPLYQLLRQHLLGYRLKDLKIVNEFEVVSMDFSGNTSLQTVPKQLRPLVTEEHKEVVGIWNRVLEGYKMRHITVDDFMAHVEQIEGVDLNWRSYVRGRYGV